MIGSKNKRSPYFSTFIFVFYHILNNMIFNGNSSKSQFLVELSTDIDASLFVYLFIFISVSLMIVVISWMYEVWNL